MLYNDKAPLSLSEGRTFFLGRENGGMILSSVYGGSIEHSTRDETGRTASANYFELLTCKMVTVHCIGNRPEGVGKA